MHYNKRIEKLSFFVPFPLQNGIISELLMFHWTISNNSFFDDDASKALKVLRIVIDSVVQSSCLKEEDREMNFLDDIIIIILVE